MMRSMFSGVSGLQAHQLKMDVIGNNIANVNTVGFKASRVTFQEVFNQTMKGAGSPDSASGRGGTNPMQVGLGTGVGSVDLQMTRGSVQRTDNPLDLAIEGDGFFIVKGAGGTYEFTKAGNFGFDKLGNLVTSGGLNVYGWQDYGGKAQSDGTYSFNTEDPIQPINIYSDEFNKNKRLIAAKATTDAVFSGNLDASKTALGSAAATDDNKQFSVPVTVYDSLGNDYKVNINFWKMTASGTTASGVSGKTTWFWSLDNSVNSSGSSGYISFDANGQIIDDGSGNNTPTIKLIPDPSVGTEPFNIKLNFANLTMFRGDSSVKPSNVNGYPTGNLESFSIGSNGILMGIYSNGKQQPLGMIALASFDNPQGLEKVGDNLFMATTNSGDFQKALKPGSEGVGDLNPGTLEMSNVDLSKEFTDMIITQRGFQANSRIITTSDEMLQELVNLKR